jgi:hypothetical protein
MENTTIFEYVLSCLDQCVCGNYPAIYGCDIVDEFVPVVICCNNCGNMHIDDKDILKASLEWNKLVRKEKGIIK